MVVALNENPNNLPVGSVRLYTQGGLTNYLMINTPTGWQGIGLVNVAGVPLPT